MMEFVPTMVVEKGGEVVLCDKRRWQYRVRMSCGLAHPELCCVCVCFFHDGEGFQSAEPRSRHTGASF
jgi:hypothetical protein